MSGIVFVNMASSIKVWLCLLISLCFFSIMVRGDDETDDNDATVEDAPEIDEEQVDKDKWKKKKIQDYDESDMEKLYDQWEEDEDEPLADDELPEWKRKPQSIDMNKLNLNDPEGMLKMTKKGKSLMMFATVAGNPTEKETESISSLWQTSMFNAHLELQRYIVASDRVLFMLTDGSKAWDVKKYLIEQDNCVEVTIDGQSYPGKGAKNKKKDNNVKIPKKNPGDKATEKKKKDDKEENQTHKKKTEL